MPDLSVQPRNQTTPNTLTTAEVNAPAQTSASMPVLTASAHRAVEAVLGVVERLSVGDRHAVELQFSVGGADLKVHVVLRDAEVHATFRTNEPDLRTALAQEWQSISAGAEGDRSWRFAAPVFSGTESGGSFARSGDNAPRQDAQPQRQPEFSAPVVSRRRVDTPAQPVGTSRSGHISGASLLETQA